MSNAGKLDSSKLASILIILGFLGTFSAFIWWSSFYRQVTEDLHTPLSEVFRCLYHSGGECAFISGLAEMVGVTPYNPTLFWVELVLIAVGIIMKISISKSD